MLNKFYYNNKNLKYKYNFFVTKFCLLKKEFISFRAFFQCCYTVSLSFLSLVLFLTRNRPKTSSYKNLEENLKTWNNFPKINGHPVFDTKKNSLKT